MSISEFNDFSMSKWSEIQWFFHDFFIFTNFKHFSWNSMIFPWSWNRSEFQWFFKSCGNPAFCNRNLIHVHISVTQNGALRVMGLVHCGNFVMSRYSDISMSMISGINRSKSSPWLRWSLVVAWMGRARLMNISVFLLMIALYDAVLPS